MPHALYIPFVFALGACVGSFLNVVVWRLPQIDPPEGTPWWKRPYLYLQGLSHPPSYCPKCKNRLKWYDNVPILGWIKLGGKCRFCKEPISSRYPIVEAVTAVLFVGLYAAYYMVGVGPCPPVPQTVFLDAPGLLQHAAPQWPFFFLHLFLLSALLAASLIDADLTIIPLPIPVTILVVGLVAHAVFDDPRAAGAVSLVVRSSQGPLVASPAAALAAGGAVGLIASWVLAARGVLKKSFAEGDPLFPGEREQIEQELEEENRKRRKAGQALEYYSFPPDYTRKQIRAEMRKEMAFLLPPMLCGVLFWVLTERVPAVRAAWQSATQPHWATGLLGAVFGALVGGAVVWVTRILGTLGFGRLAMGLGDVDLMFGVGAVIGAGPAVIAFFLAPFAGLLLSLYLIVFGKQRHIPYGPYLGMASVAVLLCYCPIAKWLEPGLAGLGLFARQLAGGAA
ncbi:MAG TPA: prepilin peptidase [Humisphaera sp.]